MQKTILNISITLRGPLLTQSSSPGELGFDVVVARNHNEKPYLPGTLISGKIRQSLEELTDAIQGENKPDWFAPKLDDWLGKPSENDFAVSKRLFFSDFILNDNELEPSKTRYRIKIDQDRGAVEQHQIVMLENPFISGESYSFTGQVHFFSSQPHAEIIRQHIAVAIKWFSHLGALKSIGFGQVENAEICKIEELAIPTSSNTPSLTSDKIRFSIQPQYPCCLSGKPNANNLFDSECIIPGSAIKGCIANTWNHLLDEQKGTIEPNNTDSCYAELRENFSLIRICHAFPGKQENERPVVAPLSIVTTVEEIEPDTKKTHYYDVAQLTKPSLIGQQAPDFSVDWKDTENTLTTYPWPYIRFQDWGWDKLHSELRVHTAINRKSRRSAKNELYAYEQIIPEDKYWYGEFDLTKIASSETQTKVLEQIQRLCQHGIIGLGKTKTPANIQFIDKLKPAINSKLEPLENNIWLITLQTDTLLGSPENLNESSGKEELQNMYEQLWDEISNSKLTLLRYFARQRMTGGRFRKQTMQKQTMQNEQENYRPWLLTEAGSLFVLQANTANDIEDIQTRLKCWMEQGLPLAQSAISWYRLRDDPQQHWKYTPFVPENGYGEIAINLQSENITQLKDSDQNVNAINPIESIETGASQ